VTILLETCLPSLTSLEEGFSSLLDLHCTEGEKETDERDVKYLSNLESTGWLSAVGTCIRLASDLAEKVSAGQIVVLVEGEGRGTSLLVSSLARLLLCEDSRTRTGFEALIQSYWVSLGYPFSRAHALSGGSQSNTLSNLNVGSRASISVGLGGSPGVNPLFFLFLDCIHQICLQFPSMLEFVPGYLIAIWDTALLPVFDSFIFDSEHDRSLARSSPETPLRLYSAWDWSHQFSPSQISSWDNPLFGIPLPPPRTKGLQPSPASMIMGRETLPIFPESKKFLNVSGDMANLHVWDQLFHRSVPFLQINDSWALGLAKVRKDAQVQVATMMNSTHPRDNNRNHNKNNQSSGRR